MAFLKRLQRSRKIAPEQSEIGDSAAEHPVQTSTEDTSSAEDKPESEYKWVFSLPSVKIALLVTVLSFALSVTFYFSSGFAEIYSRTAGRFLRAVITKVTGIFPFSVAETLFVIFFPFVIYSVIRIIYEAVKKVDHNKRYEIRFQQITILFLMVFLSIYNLSYASCNKRAPLEDNLGLERKALTAQQLYDSIVVVEKELDKCYEEGDIRFSMVGSTVSPYSFEELNEKLNGLYKKTAEKYPFIDSFSSRVKPVSLSKYLSYTHISGFYSSYTGEVNINTCYPDYLMTFSMAHEMAHQRGFAREDEANFVAFIVMYESDDPYLKYCALAELFSYLSDALYYESEELFYQAMAQCDIRIMYEMAGYAYFSLPYQNSTAGKIAEAVNDVSIKIRGDSDGAKSYDMMIELAAAYFKTAE